MSETYRQRYTLFPELRHHRLKNIAFCIRHDCIFVIQTTCINDSGLTLQRKALCVTIRYELLGFTLQRKAINRKEYMIHISSMCFAHQKPLA